MLDLFERVLGLLLVVDVEFHQALAGGGEGGEIGREGDAREFALQVGGVAGTVLGMVEKSVGGVEDISLGDAFARVAGAVLGERPVGKSVRNKRVMTIKGFGITSKGVGIQTQSGEI
jgi:hypothetical protein